MIRSPITGRTPANPAPPDPRKIRKSTVSAWSERVWPTAILSYRPSSTKDRKYSYRILRAACSRLSPLLRASDATAKDPRSASNPSSCDSSATNSRSRSDSGPRNWWSRWTTPKVTPRRGPSSRSAYSSATESGPPETATPTRSPGRSIPYLVIVPSMPRMKFSISTSVTPRCHCSDALSVPSVKTIG